MLLANHLSSTNHPVIDQTVLRITVAEGDTICFSNDEEYCAYGYGYPVLAEGSTEITIDWGDGTVETYDGKVLEEYTDSFIWALHTYTRAITNGKLKISNDLANMEIDAYSEYESYYKIIGCDKLGTKLKYLPYGFFSTQITNATFRASLENVEIGDSLFSGCTGITSVFEKPVDGVLTIPFSSEYEGTGITELPYQECSEFRGHMPFNGCPITSVSLPTVTRDKIDTFYLAGLTACTNISLPMVSGESISFKFMNNLVTITIGEISSIPEGCFHNCTKLAELPSQFSAITEIPAYAFSGCASLTSISLPNVTSIPNSCFSGCKSLTVVDFPNVVSVGEAAFSQCSSISKLNLPLCASVGDFAFSQCSTLTTVELLEVLVVGRQCFQNCTSLTSLRLPKCHTAASFIISGSTEVEELYMPSLTKIVCTPWANYAYFLTGQHPKLKTISFPSLEDSCGFSLLCGVEADFVDLPALTNNRGSLLEDSWRNNNCSVNFPESLTELTTNITYRCPKLLDLNFNGVTKASGLIFPTDNDYPYVNRVAIRFPKMTCAQLKASTGFPFANHTRDGWVKEAFKDCDATFICSDGTLVYSSDSNTWEKRPLAIRFLVDVQTGEEYIFYSILTTQDGTGHINWGDGSDIVDVPFSTGDRSVYRHTYSADATVWVELYGDIDQIMGNVKYPILRRGDSVSTPTIRRIEIDGGFTETLTEDGLYLGASAFARYPSVRSIDLSRANLGESMAARQFLCNTEMEECFLPSTLTSLSTTTFSQCASLRSITIPPKVTTINTSCFNKCSSLKSVKFPYALKSLGTSCFNESAVELIDLSCTDLTAIGSTCFNNCTSLKEIRLPKHNSALTLIPSSMSPGCTSLEYIDIPETVTTIGDGAFYNCKSVKYVVCRATTPPNAQSSTSHLSAFNINGDSTPSSIPVYVPSASIDAYKSSALFNTHFSNFVALEGSPYENDFDNPYADDSLIQMFDGYWQEQVGKKSVNGNTWTDLAGGLTADVSDQMPTSDGAVEFDGNGYAAISGLVSNVRTVEFTLRNVDWTNSNYPIIVSWGAGIQDNACNGFIWIDNLESAPDELWVYANFSGKTNSQWRANKKPFIKALHPNVSVTVVYDETKDSTLPIDPELKTHGLMSIYVDGEKVGDADYSAEEYNYAVARIGGDDDGWNYCGEVCAIRMYSRPLTDVEIKAHYEIDKERFSL